MDDGPPWAAPNRGGDEGTWVVVGVGVGVDVGLRVGTLVGIGVGVQPMDSDGLCN